MTQGETGRTLKLLSGGNPQIPKGFGDGPVQDYIAAIPGWKQEVGRRLDEIITSAVPGVKKAVKWNSPLYGIEEGVWFASFHCFTNYVKLSFFQGTSLHPVPPEPSKVDGVRYLHVREHDTLDEDRLADWMVQASRLPGQKM